MPPPQVGVITTKFQQVALQTELPARVEAIRTAQVRARVNGVVLKRLFTEGSIVKQGQSLFQIDPEPYQAQLNSRPGRAGPRPGQPDLGRRPGRTLQAAGRSECGQQAGIHQRRRRPEAGGSRRGIAAKAQCKIAQINSSYANVYAPISGRIGRALVTEGALVSATEATQMALIQQTDTMYLNITQSATELQRLRKKAGNKDIDSAIPVTVVLDDGTELAARASCCSPT
jgi:membrane fusion protein (multidrug efflux system)